MNNHLNNNHGREKEENKPIAVLDVDISKPIDEKKATE